MKKALLIGLHGKPRVGKDTLAEHLIFKYNLLRFGPSVPVKLTTAAMFDFPVRYLDDNDKKDTLDPFWGMTYRQMAQLVGKESSRDIFGEDIWMRHVERKLKEIQHYLQVYRVGEPGVNPPYTAHPVYHGLILADIRYANEAKWVRDHGGHVIFVIRDDAPKTSDKGHPAESGLPLQLADIVLYNNGTIAEFYDMVNTKLEFLGDV